MNLPTDTSAPGKSQWNNPAVAGAPVKANPALKDAIRLKINQQRRELVCVEVCSDYSLMIYSMPAGRAFLTRVWGVAGSYAYKPASKPERTRHALALALTEIDNSYDLEDAASDCRSYRVATRRQKVAIDFRCKVARNLAHAIVAGMAVPAEQIKDVRGVLEDARGVATSSIDRARRIGGFIGNETIWIDALDAALAKLPLDTAP